jgi:predicted dehydrogenase
VIRSDELTSGSARNDRVRIGVIGCGLIAQVMHLHYLGELTDRFHVSALCDLSPSARAFAGDHFFPEAQRFEDWQELLRAPLDAVMILTPGSHAPIAIAAAEQGLHLFVEKPLAFSSAEAGEVVAAAESASVCLLVGYMKRYDPAYEVVRERARAIDNLRLVRVTTLESAIDTYVGHYPLRRTADVDEESIAELEADDRRRVAAAIGSAADDPTWYWAYRVVLLDCMVHEINALRGLLGEPTELRFAHASAHARTLTAAVAFGPTECLMAWTDLPGIAHYEQEFSLVAPNERLGLVFPSPFVRNLRTRIVSEGGTPDTAHFWRTSEHGSYESPFKRELVEFHECIVERREPRTGGGDAARDLAFCEAFIRAGTDRTSQPDPSAPGATVTSANQQTTYNRKGFDEHQSVVY